MALTEGVPGYSFFCVSHFEGCMVLRTHAAFEVTPDTFLSFDSCCACACCFFEIRWQREYLGHAQWSGRCPVRCSYRHVSLCHLVTDICASMSVISGRYWCPLFLSPSLVRCLLGLVGRELSASSLALELIGDCRELLVLSMVSLISDPCPAARRCLSLPMFVPVICLSD